MPSTHETAQTVDRTSADTGIVRAGAPVGAVAYVLGHVNGEVEHPYWLDVESEIAHQRARGMTVVECDREGEAVFTGTPTDAAIAHLETEVTHLRSAIHDLAARLDAAGAVLSAPRQRPTKDGGAS